MSIIILLLSECIDDIFSASFCTKITRMAILAFLVGSSYFFLFPMWC